MLLLGAAGADHHQPAAAERSHVQPVPVELLSAAEDRTAKRLTVLVRREFEGDPRFTLVSGQAPKAMLVSLAARVGWERRLDWTEISYQVRLSSHAATSAVITAVCWNWNLESCARQIVSATAEHGSRQPAR